MHHPAILLVTVLMCSSAQAQIHGELLKPEVAPLSFKAQQALAERLGRRVVQIRRSLPRIAGRRTPGAGAQRGAGWLARSGRVVTASALLRDWPIDDTDRIEVAGEDGVWRPAAVGLLDARLGLAVLDVPDLKSMKEHASAPPDDRAIRPGRALFSTLGGKTLVKGVVSAPATGQWSYYFWLEGVALPLGTPLFDGAGRFVSLVGLKSASSPGRELVLPGQAIRALFERTLEWMP